MWTALFTNIEVNRREVKMKDTKVMDMKNGIDLESIKVAGQWIYEGKTVAFPTETVYGLGANALDEEAIFGIYHAKGRPSDNPLIVHISREEMLHPLVKEIPEYVRLLMDAFWPGPMALIFNKSDQVPLVTTGGLETVAIRMPNHPIALALIESSGVPIAAPSANLSGKPSPTVGEYVIRDMMGRVDCIIDGGEVAVGLESTVLDVTGDVPMILRPGKITQEDIIEVVGACELDKALIKSDDTIVAKAPGMKYRHYAPEAKVSVYEGGTLEVLTRIESEAVELAKAKTHVAIMVFEEDEAFLRQLFKQRLTSEEMNYIHFLIQGSAKDLSVFARQLFRDLCVSDDLNCREVLVRGVSEHGLGRAIMNRLKKASEGRMFKI